MFNRYINESNEKDNIIRSINNSKIDKKLKDILISIVNIILIDNDEILDVKSIVSGVVKNTSENDFGDTVLNSKNITSYNDFMDFIEDTQSQSVISKIAILLDRYSKYLDSLEKPTKNTSKKKSKTTVQPKTTKELVQIIRDYCEKNGWNSDLNFIDTSLITDMKGLFGEEPDSSYEYGYGLDKFNGDISQWDVSNVKTMEAMFSGAKKFNQPLNNWDVSNVEDMRGMFYNARSFNQPLNNWDVSNVRNMNSMFNRAVSFNQSLNNWDVSRVSDMYMMFTNAITFNQPLDKWDVSRVEDMFSMFHWAASFNQPLNNWDVSRVRCMTNMFYGAEKFNQPLNNWDVSNVKFMANMFADAESFNQPLDKWDVSRVKDMYTYGGMFKNSKLEKIGKLPKWYND